MSQHCPVCRARIWTDPIFSPSRLRCPRCGAEFSPTVPWIYFRILLLVVVILCLIVILLLTQGNLYLFLFLLGLAALLWFLPRIIDLKHVGPELTPSEGVLDPNQLELELEDRRFQENFEEHQEKRNFRGLIYLLLSIGLLIFLIAALISEG